MSTTFGAAQQCEKQNIKIIQQFKWDWLSMVAQNEWLKDKQKKKEEISRKKRVKYYKFVYKSDFFFVWFVFFFVFGLWERVE